MSAFCWPARVYWEDTDAGGVVYYANYLRFLERARTEWLRSMGIEQMPLKEQYGVLMVVAQIEANYRRPARYGDELRIVSRVVELGKVSLSFEQRVLRASTDAAEDEVLLDGKIKVACIDATSFRPKPLPEMIIGSLQTK